MSAPVLEFVGVHGGYGSAQVLNGMSFAVDEGECFALIGPNGVGKTTTCNALFGLASRSAGAILIDGREVDARVPHMAARFGASLVPQGRQIFTSLSIQDNLLLGGASRRPGPWTLAKLYKLFPVLANKSSALGSALSGGEQQMLAIARALMSNPRVLVLDEPTEGLAPVIVDELATTLRQLQSEGISMLFIEQRIDLVASLASRFSVVRKGTADKTGEIADVSLDQLRLLAAP